MIQLLLLAVLAYGGYQLWRWLRAAPPQQRRRRYTQAGLTGLAIVALLLAATGRVHWLGAVVVALLPVLQRVLLLALRLLPMALPWLRRRLSGGQGSRDRPDQGASGPAAGDGALSRSDALAILGLPEGADREQILQAHRRLMQKLHPDRGGSDYLAARINAAKEKLLRDQV